MSQAIVSPFDGYLLVNKPVGMSSFAVVHALRKVTGVKRIGHAGTLDPFASGLLIVAIGRAFTRHLDRFQALSKQYWVKMGLGISTDTLDPYGEIVSQDTTGRDNAVTLSDFEGVRSQFLEEILQVPPQFSALKVDGKRLYKQARQGKTVEIEPRPVHVYDIFFLEFYTRSIPFLCFTVHCSKGTYVRSLVRDMAEAVGTVAFTQALHRQKIGPYDSNDALHVGDFTAETVRQHRFLQIDDTEDMAQSNDSGLG